MAKRTEETERTETGNRRRGRPNIREDVPVSLAPLDFETALAGLLQVKPETEKRPAAKKQVAKKRASKKKR